MSQTDATQKIEEWRRDYNEARPHESLGYLAPREFAQIGQGMKRPERV